MRQYYLLVCHNNLRENCVDIKMSSFVTPHHLTYLMLILAFNFDYDEQSNIDNQNENQCKNEIEK